MFALFFFGIVFLFFAALGIVVIVDTIKNKEGVAGWATGCIALLIALATAIVVYLEISGGATVTYKAIVTDFNEVYDNGYEIIDQEDKIYTLEKVGE